MKISMVLASENNGGLEKHVRELSHELVVQGHQVSVIAPNVFLNTLNDSVEKLAINVKRSRFNPLLLWQLYQHLKEVDADIVHAQANKAAKMVGLLSRFIKKPMVATIHSMKSNRRAFLAFKHIICVSQHITTGFEANQHVAVIYNGIHQTPYQKIDLNNTFDLPAGKPVICAVGRLVKAKAFDVLLEAVDGLSVNLLIVGDGPDYQPLLDQAKKLSPNTHCQLIGHREDVNDLIYSADALVISSRREGFPYVFVEAVMSQAKIISTSVPVAEVLPAELIVPINDAKALREKLAYYMRHQAEWDALMQPVRGFAKEALTCEKMTQHTMRQYDAILVSM